MKKNICGRLIFVIAAIQFIFAVSNSANASVKSYQQEPGGVVFTLDKGMMIVKICKDDLVEVQYTVLDKLAPEASLIVVNGWKLNHKMLNFGDMPLKKKLKI